VALHVGPERIIHRAALGELAGQLDARRFARVHRSAVINIDGVMHLELARFGRCLRCA
jgi:two-component system, LytTR family, response regulator